MSENEAAVLRKQAQLAIREKDFQLALERFKKLAEKDVPDGIFMCGVIHENRWDESLHDLDQAFTYYRKLAIKWNADSGYLGCVRVILANKDVRCRETALEYCQRIVKGEERRYGYLTMGRIYEELYDPPLDELARSAYFRSFRSGSSWALRRYANSLMRSGHYLKGIAMHVVASVVSPFLLLFGGLGATRQDG